MTPRANRRRGFALLEALVAIVLVAGVGSALFALINVGLQGLLRAEAHAESVSLQPHVLSWLRTIEIDNLAESWESELSLTSQKQQYDVLANFTRIQGPAYTKDTIGAPGIHLIALYDVTVTIRREGRLINRFVTRRVESEQIAPPPQP